MATAFQRMVIEMAIETVMQAVSIESPECKFCQSVNVVKNGRRNNVQYYLCRECGRGFVHNKALPRGKYPMRNIGSALYQYYAGSSLSDVSGYIEQQTGNRPSKSAVYNWIMRFSKVAIDEGKQHTPQVGDVWVADETVLHIGGGKYWLWDIIDEKTRFLLATHLSPTRTTKDARELVEAAARKAGKAPTVIRTDFLASYIDAIELAFGADTKHVQSKPFIDRDSTNVIERFHGTLKDRVKVMRDLKTPETANQIVDGWLIFYNYFRPHESLRGKTPADAAKVCFPFKNWLDVVKSQSPVAQERSSVVPLAPQPYRKRTQPKAKRRRTKPQRVYPKAVVVRSR